MAGYTTAMPNTFKVELATGVHDFTNSTGGTMKLALGIPSPTGTYGTLTTNYSDLTGNSDEVASGGGYTTGGKTLTNVTPLKSTTQTYWNLSSSDPSWTSATFSTRACIGYNSSKSNKAFYVGDFGGTQTVTAGTLTLVQPANGAGTSLMQLN